MKYVTLCLALFAAALFVAGEDENAYARAIEQLIGDAALRLRLGNTACERAARYTPAAMAGDMLRLYGRLLGAPLPHPRVAA